MNLKLSTGALPCIADTFMTDGHSVLIVGPTGSIRTASSRSLRARASSRCALRKKCDFPWTPWFTPCDCRRSAARESCISKTPLNDPTVNSVLRDELVRFCVLLRERWCLSMEPIFDFSGLTILPWIGPLSKSAGGAHVFKTPWGLAALRVGCLFGRVEILRGDCAGPARRIP